MTREELTQKQRAKGSRTRTRVRLGGGSPTEVRARLDRLVEFAKGHRRALILTHDNPDPDSLASGVALAWLLEQLAGVQAEVAYGGIVGRAENRALVKVLKLPVVPISRVVFDDYDLICMVDTQPEQGNHSLPARHFPDVVIDHHPERPETRLAAIADVGAPIGATSTVVVDYLRASGLEVPAVHRHRALLRHQGRHPRPGAADHGPDVEAYLWLFPRADKDALAQIEHPPLPGDYFASPTPPSRRPRSTAHAVVCPRASSTRPDMVAEVAERFLSLGDVRWSLAFGRVRGRPLLLDAHHATGA